MWEEIVRKEDSCKKQKYPKSTQVLKQLVSGRNAQQYRADSFAAQAPGWEKRENQWMQQSDYKFLF